MFVSVDQGDTSQSKEHLLDQTVSRNYEGRVHGISDIVCVLFVSDTISEFKLQPYDRYLTSGPKRQSSPEF